MSGRLFGLQNGNAKLPDSAVETMRYLADGLGPRFKPKHMALIRRINVKTVDRIVRGKRRETGPGPIDRPVELLPDGTAKRDPVRCPGGCGQRVYLPEGSDVCLACALRRGDVLPLALALEDDDSED